MVGQDKFRWLSLVDYANKYKVSISTLRRKIKIEDIPFRLDSGKYYIVDEPLGIIEKSQGDQLDLDNSNTKYGQPWSHFVHLICVCQYAKPQPDRPSQP